MAQFVPEKRILPLKNPPQEKATTSTSYPCKYCEWSSSSNVALSYHLSRYHEDELAAEGKKSLREGGDKWERNRKYLLAHGYVKCPWWPEPCPTKINSLVARVCKHMNDCPT